MLKAALRGLVYEETSSPVGCFESIRSAIVLGAGFKQTSGDPCLYVPLDSEGEMFLVAVYVDGIILGGKSDVKMSSVKKELSHKFEMKDLGLLHYFLGVKVIQNGESGVIWVGQPVFTEKIQSFISISYLFLRYVCPN